MPKLPVNLGQGRAALAGLAAVVGPQVVALLKDPARAEQLTHLVAGLGPALKARTPEGRLTAKIAALRGQAERIAPGDALRPTREAWLLRLDALEAKRTLVVAASTGRTRSARLKEINRQADDLLAEFLTLSDAAIRGE